MNYSRASQPVILYLILLLSKLTGIFSLENAQTDAEDAGERSIVIVQKCCAQGQKYVNDECSNSTTDFYLNVYRSNDTHYWLIKNVQFEIEQRKPCKIGYTFNSNESDQWALLENGSLYIKYDCTMHDKDEYCMETISPDSDVKPYICTKVPINIAMYFDAAGQILSFFFLVGMSVMLHYSEYLYKDLRRCLILAFSSMAASYLFLIILTFMNICLTIVFCKILWCANFYATLVYHYWFSIFAYELYRTAKPKPKSISLLLRYCGIAFFLPLVSTIFVCIILDSLPREYALNYSTSDKDFVAYLVLFYFPILISTIGNVITILYLIRRLKPGKITNEVKKMNLEETIKLLTRDDTICVSPINKTNLTNLNTETNENEDVQIHHSPDALVSTNSTQINSIDEVDSKPMESNNANHNTSNHTEVVSTNGINSQNENDIEGYTDMNQDIAEEHLTAISEHNIVDTTNPNIAESFANRHAVTDQSGIDELDTLFNRRNLNYRCCIMYILIFVVTLLNLIVFCLPKAQSNEAPQLLVQQIFTSCLGVFCVLVFFQKDYFSYCNHSNCCKL